MPDILSVELKRPGPSHSWGICFAVLPDGPEILRVMRESPAFGKLKNGQIIKKVNGQPVQGLTREEIGELLAAGDEDLIIDVQDRIPFDYRVREFGHEYNRRSVEPSGLPRRQSEFSLFTHRRRDSNASNSSHKGSTTDMPSVPNVLHEFERIHQQRKQSRELTLSQFENARAQQNARMQRCMSVDRPVGPMRILPPQQNRWMPAGMPRPALPNGRPSNGVVDYDQPVIAESRAENVEKAEQGADPMSNLRYMGTQIPSRTFKALASLLGMDDPHNASIEAASKEPCRTVIDVRAKAEEMRREAERKASLSGFSPPASNGLLSPDALPSQTVDPA